MTTTYHEYYTKMVNTSKRFEQACTRYGRNPTAENFEETLRLEEKLNGLEDKLKELTQQVS